MGRGAGWCALSPVGNRSRATGVERGSRSGGGGGVVGLLGC